MKHHIEAPKPNESYEKNYQLQISNLQNDNLKLQKELSSKSLLLTHKDKQILDLSNENTRLHLKVDNFFKELDYLKSILNRKD